jgi:MtN3 and saliva related transmembrane protein
MLENFTGLLAILATAFGVVMSIANLPQTFKIIKRKSCADVSLATYLLLMPGSIIWLLYGLSLNNMPLISSNLIGAIATFSVILVYYIYKK